MRAVLFGADGAVGSRSQLHSRFIHHHVRGTRRYQVHNTAVRRIGAKLAHRKLRLCSAFWVNSLLRRARKSGYLVATNRQRPRSADLTTTFNALPRTYISITPGGDQSTRKDRQTDRSCSGFGAVHEKEGGFLPCNWPDLLPANFCTSRAVVSACRDRPRESRANGANIVSHFHQQHHTRSNQMKNQQIKQTTFPVMRPGERCRYIALVSDKQISLAPTAPTCHVDNTTSAVYGAGYCTQVGRANRAPTASHLLFGEGYRDTRLPITPHFPA